MVGAYTKNRCLSFENARKWVPSGQKWSKKCALVDTARRTRGLKVSRTRTPAERCRNRVDKLAQEKQGSSLNNRVAQCVKAQIQLSSPDGKVEWVPSRSQAQGNSVGLVWDSVHVYGIYLHGHVTGRSRPTVPSSPL